MALLRLFLTAGSAVVLYGVYKAVYRISALYFSPIRDLPGPKSKSFVWGNLGEIRKAENSKLHEEWVEKYGKVIKYKGFFNVSPRTGLCFYSMYSHYPVGQALHDGHKSSEPHPDAFRGLSETRTSTL